MTAPRVIRSRRTRALSYLRRAAEALFGRRRLWSWLLDREFAAMAADRRRAVRRLP